MFENLSLILMLCALVGFTIIALVLLFRTAKPAKVYDPHGNSTVEVKFADMAKIPNHESLYYSVNTRTVYYLNFGCYDIVTMMPYISNGCYCKYVNGKIEEVVPRVIIENAAN